MKKRESGDQLDGHAHADDEVRYDDPLIGYECMSLHVLPVSDRTVTVPRAHLLLLVHVPKVHVAC